MRQRVTIVWRNRGSESLKTDVESWEVNGTFVILSLPSDLMRPSVKSRRLMLPSDLVRSVEIEEVEDEDAPAGYREESTFREEPGKSRWFSGVGARPHEEG